jgi:hypothetical protein
MVETVIPTNPTTITAHRVKAVKLSVLMSKYVSPQYTTGDIHIILRKAVLHWINLLVNYVVILHISVIVLH